MQRRVYTKPFYMPIDPSPAKSKGVCIHRLINRPIGTSPAACKGVCIHRLFHRPIGTSAAACKGVCKHRLFHKPIEISATNYSAILSDLAWGAAYDIRRCAPETTV